MSYKEKVVIRIESKITTLDDFVKELKDNLSKHWEKDLFEYGEIKIFYDYNVRLNVSVVIIDLPNCNWYNYEKEHYSRIIEDTLENYEDKINYHFVRIGEDLDDMEEEIHGEMKKYLEIVREVKY